MGFIVDELQTVNAVDDRIAKQRAGPIAEKSEDRGVERKGFTSLYRNFNQLRNT